MALNAQRTWLIAYDIRDPRRLRRVHAYLKERAVPVQYSVFVTRASAKEIGDIRSGLAQKIDRRCDDVRIYHVPDGAELVTLGGNAVPDGIQLVEGRGPAMLAPFTANYEYTEVGQPPGERFKVGG